MKKQNITNFTSYYEEIINQNSNVNLRGAILGLGEVGNENHVKLIVSFLEHNRVGIVKAAIRAFAMLDANKYIDNFIEMLNHEHTDVSKEAMKCLQTTSYTDKKDELYRIHKESNYKHTRYNVAILLCSFPKWDAIQYIIEFYVNRVESDMYNLGRFQFTNWLANFNRTFDAPSKTQIASIKKVIEQKAVGVYLSTSVIVEKPLMSRLNDIGIHKWNHTVNNTQNSSSFSFLWHYFIKVPENEI